MAHVAATSDRHSAARRARSLHRPIRARTGTLNLSPATTAAAECPAGPSLRLIGCDSHTASRTVRPTQPAAASQPLLESAGGRESLTSCAAIVRPGILPRIQQTTESRFRSFRTRDGRAYSVPTTTGTSGHERLTQDHPTLKVTLLTRNDTPLTRAPTDRIPSFQG